MTGREIRSDTDAKPMTADPWPVAWSALLASVFGVTLIFSDTVAGMIRIWSNSDAFGHGFLIAPISAFLLWHSRDRLANVSPRPCFWGLTVLAVALFAWLLGRLAGFLVLENFAFVAVIQSLFLIVLGWRAVRVLAFPLFYLIVMVPFGEFLIPFLQDLTASLVVQGLRIVNIPVFLDGVMLIIPTGAFEVAEACAGLRFMIAVLALGLIFAHLAYDDWLRRGIFMTIAVCVTIVGNALRAFGIVVLAYVTNHEVAVGIDHLIYGWVFLSFLLIVLFLLGFKLRKNDVGRSVSEPRPTPGTGNPDPAPKALFVATALCLVLVVGATSSYAAFSDARSSDRHDVTLQAPASQTPWVQSPVANDKWRPRFKGTDVELLVNYRADDLSVDLYLAYYREQRQGAEVVNAQNQIAPSPDWSRLGDQTVSVSIADQRFDALATLVKRTEGRRRVILRWFWVGHRMTGSPVRAKFNQVWSIISGGPRAAAVVVVSAEYENDPEEALKTLRSFISALSSLDTTLAEPESRRQAASGAGSSR